MSVVFTGFYAWPLLTSTVQPSCIIGDPHERKVWLEMMMGYTVLPDELPMDPDPSRASSQPPHPSPSCGWDAGGWVT